MPLSITAKATTIAAASGISVQKPTHVPQAISVSPSTTKVMRRTPRSLASMSSRRWRSPPSGQSQEVGP